MRRYSTQRTSYIIAALALFAALWFVIAALVRDDLVFPSPVAIAQALAAVVTKANFIWLLLSTLGRCVVSFAIAITLATVLSTVAAFVRFVYNLMLPIQWVLSSLPTTAFIVLALVWFGKDAAPVLLGVLIAFPVFYEVVQKGIRGTDENLLEMAETFAVPRIRIFRAIYLHEIGAALGSVAFSTGMLIIKVVIAGELFGQPRYGIGAEIQSLKMAFDIPAVVAWIIIVAAVSFGFDAIGRLVTRRRQEVDA